MLPLIQLQKQSCPPRKTWLCRRKSTATELPFMKIHRHFAVQAPALGPYQMRSSSRRSWRIFHFLDRPDMAILTQNDPSVLFSTDG
mmetsp:Transcript_17828/g.29517  ORF Transcript_17828/g.29517 Transcript_17828/m.29517 type:complete len:86 (+) Transcript_17828:1698-1955(+)